MAIIVELDPLESSYRCKTGCNKKVYVILYKAYYFNRKFLKQQGFYVPPNHIVALNITEYPIRAKI